MRIPRDLVGIGHQYFISSLAVRKNEKERELRMQLRFYEFFIRWPASSRSCDFVGIMSRSEHARDAYLGISYRLWQSFRIKRTLVASIPLGFILKPPPRCYLNGSFFVLFSFSLSLIIH